MSNLIHNVRAVSFNEPIAPNPLVSGLLYKSVEEGYSASCGMEIEFNDHTKDDVKKPVVEYFVIEG